MIHQLYNILLTCVLIFSFPYFFLRGLIQRRLREGLFQRMGFSPCLPFVRPIWIHAASVGEVFCSVPLVRRIRRDYPDCKIVLTTMTRTGNEAAKNKIPQADAILLFPTDHPLMIGRMVKKIQPACLLIAETELWPNLLRSCGKEGIPIILFNGRISKKSFQRYLFVKSLFRDCLKHISLFLMQTEEDRTRITKIGAPLEKTRVMGNLKFDQPFPSLSQEKMTAMANSLGLQREQSVLIAGSTHPGEEEILFSLFKPLRKDNPHLILILAPRHLERVEEVERILKKESIPWIRKTSLSVDGQRSPQKLKESPEVILLDTMGELMNLYSLGTLVFIGGSLVPIGGHNPLEPLFFKKCVLFGPYMFNFLEISRSLVEAGGAVQVKGTEDLSLCLKRLLSDEGAREEVGERGYRFLEKHQGATERVFGEIQPFLKNISDRKFKISN